MRTLALAIVAVIWTLGGPAAPSAYAQQEARPWGRGDQAEPWPQGQRWPQAREQAKEQAKEQARERARERAERDAREREWRDRRSWRDRPDEEEPRRDRRRRDSEDQDRPAPPRYDQSQRHRAPSSLLPQDEDGRSVIQQFMPHDRARRAVEAGEIRPLGDIRRAVQRQFDGRIVGIELHENRRGGPSYIYDVRVLTRRGDVLSVAMDAHTGQVIDVRGGR